MPYRRHFYLLQANRSSFGNVVTPARKQLFFKSVVNSVSSVVTKLFANETTHFLIALVGYSAIQWRSRNTVSSACCRSSVLLHAPSVIDRTVHNIFCVWKTRDQSTTVPKSVVRSSVAQIPIYAPKPSSHRFVFVVCTRTLGVADDVLLLCRNSCFSHL